MVGVCLAVMVFYCCSVFVAECYIYAIYLSFFFFFFNISDMLLSLLVDMGVCVLIHICAYTVLLHVHCAV